MRKIDVLVWGMRHIADNHGLKAHVEYEEDGEMCIYGGCNVPTLGDVLSMCEDLGLPRECVNSSEWGIDVYIYWEWMQPSAEDQNDGEYGILLEDYTPTGCELWKRYDAVIGEPYNNH